MDFLPFTTSVKTRVTTSTRFSAAWRCRRGREKKGGKAEGLGGESGGYLLDDEGPALANKINTSMHLTQL